MSGRYEPIVERYLTPVIKGSEEYMCVCPFCDGRSSLQFNIDSGLWVCFRCDSKGNAKTLVRKLGGVYADPVISVEAIRKHVDRLRLLRKKENREQRVFDDSILRRFSFPNDYWSTVRGFSDSTIARWNLGYDPIKDRHIIPYRNPAGQLLGVIQRLGDEETERANIRYIYPESFDRKGSLFGSWQIVGLKKVALVEGATDTIALDDANRPSGGQFGSSISSAQARLLHRLGVREVVLFYDYDEAGLKATEKSREVLKGFILRSVQWDTSKYCWHEKLCGCGQHTWRDIANCQQKRKCKCGRRHGMDPNALKKKERKEMFDHAKLVGSKKEWRTMKRVR
jgi:DNA primase